MSVSVKRVLENYIYSHETKRMGNNIFMRCYMACNTYTFYFLIMKLPAFVWVIILIAIAVAIAIWTQSLFFDYPKMTDPVEIRTNF